MEKMPDEIYAWMGFQDNGSWDREPCVCDSHESVKYIRADLADLSPQTVPAGWEPIKTAPTNGDVFLVCLPRQGNLILRARFDRIHKFFTTDRMSEGIIQPTFFHDGDLWMSMPEPPADGVNE